LPPGASMNESVARRGLCYNVKKRLEKKMEEHVYKVIELTGSSKVSIEDAVKNAISKAAKTVNNMRWFQIVESRGYIDKDSVSYWQVTVKIGFTVE
jgi:flavin-binding protein dodecin